MAFTLPLTINGEAQAAAYVKATIARCDTQTTVVQLQTWTSQASRDNGGQSVPDNWLPDGFSSLQVFATDLQAQANNPVAYAYTLLEQSNEFAEAVWNI